MNIVCLDMEGVLVPEIWIAFAEATGIEELKKTTRDEPDYDKLMEYRLNILKEHGLGIKEIQDTISKIDPMPGAKEFLDELRSITQVIINIVNNAVKYTPPGTDITLSARREGDTVRVEIADTGPGIPQEAQGRLFQMFYTAGNDRGDGRRGLGLGLALCKSIVEAHGGKIGMRANEPHGSVFFFTLQAEEIKL